MFRSDIIKRVSKDEGVILKRMKKYPFDRKSTENPRIERYGYPLAH